jgi:hypothetical protein
MCCLLTGLSIVALVFFALLLAGNIITGTDDSPALVGLFGAGIVLVFLLVLRALF